MPFGDFVSIATSVFAPYIIFWAVLFFVLCFFLAVYGFLIIMVIGRL